MTTLEDVIDELRQRLDDVQASNYRFRSEIHDLVNVAGTLRVSRDELKDELSECQDNYKEMCEEAKETAAAELEQLRAMAKQVGEENTNLVNTIHALRAELDEMREALDEARRILRKHTDLLSWVGYDDEAAAVLTKYPGGEK
jgi:uncharacterized coiled-coil DUF342 family protein